MLALCLAPAAVVRAAPGPQFKSARALSMGNAFAAVAGSRDALHYNPAGLNLIDRNAPSTSSLRERVDARLTLVGLHAPWDETRYGWGLYRRDDSTQDPFPPPDSGFAFTDAPLTTDIAAWRSLEFAVHDFGMAYWGESRVTHFTDIGVLLPHRGAVLQTNTVLQAARAGDLANERFSWGVGIRLIGRNEREYAASITDSTFWSNPENESGSSAYQVRRHAQDELWTTMTRPGRSSWGLGFDLGTLWQQTPWLRLGVAAQNLGLVLNGTRITPELTAGVAVTVPPLATMGAWARTVTVAADYEDALNKRLEPLSKVNFGAEVIQRFGGWIGTGLGGGFKGGYWTAGARVDFLEVVHLELVSWAEEGGTLTGERELRRYAINASVGL